MARRLKQDISMGANLRALRLKSELSREAVVKQLDLMGVSQISREILSQMELGRYSIRISVLLALKEIYNASFDDFFQGLSWKDLPSDE